MFALTYIKTSSNKERKFKAKRFMEKKYIYYTQQYIFYIE